uniref:Uncharacterized protein n=1 Tax=Meloidogyne incognita TaxID=6306 RepID=A0A914L3R2_MELIC
MFNPNFSNMFSNNFNQRLQPTPSIEDMFFQSNPNCAEITFENGHLPEMLKLIRKYPTSKLYNKYSTTQKIDQMGEDANADFAANTKLHNICQEIRNSGNPNLDCSRLYEIYQKDVKECLKRHGERNQIRKSIFTSPDNPLNKTKINPIPLPQFSSFKQSQPNPFIPQFGGVQYALPQIPPPVPHALAQNFFNHQKKSNPQYAMKPPLPVRIQNQPLPNGPGTNHQLIIAPTYAINHKQQTQQDITSIPFHQQGGQIQPQPQHISGQNQQIHQQHHVVEDHPFHPKNSLKQQVQHDRTNIPYLPIDGHIQQHVGTNNHFLTEQHNVEDDIVEKRTLDEYEHMPENVAKKSKGKSVVPQHVGDFVGHQMPGSSTPNLPPYPISAEDFVHDDVFNKHYEELMQCLYADQSNQLNINNSKNVVQNQELMQHNQRNCVNLGSGKQTDQRFLQNNHVDLEQYGNNTERNPEIYHPPIVNITSPSNSQQEEHSLQQTLSPKTPIKNPIQLNRDRLFKSPLSNVSTPVHGPAADLLALSENHARLTLNDGNKFVDSNTNPLPYNFHQGIHGFNNAGEHGMSGTTSQMPHPTFNPNYGSLMQAGQHSFQQSKQPPPQHLSQGLESITPPSSSDYTSSYDEDLSDLLGHFEDYSKESSLGNDSLQN